MIVVDIDNRLLPLARRYMTFEEDIDLAIRAILHLRQPNVRHDKADKPSPGPDIAAFATEVAARRVEHVASEVDAGDVDGVVAAAADACGEWSQADGGCFADDDP